MAVYGEDYQDSRCCCGTPGSIPSDRVLARLDEYLNQNDYSGAQRHLLYWREEAASARDDKGLLLINNEQIGLYRKLGQREKCMEAVDAALAQTEKMELGQAVGAATTYINAATAYKAFGEADKAIPLFESAREIYEAQLPAGDARLGGLYNNMALALVDLKRFGEAGELYEKALAVMKQVNRGELEQAVTYLNMATAADAEHGLEASEAEVAGLLDRAESLLEAYAGDSDGYYAFVCEKCAPTFGYYGRFMYEQTLKERAEKIYERNRAR